MIFALPFILAAQFIQAIFIIVLVGLGFVVFAKECMDTSTAARKSARRNTVLLLLTTTFSAVWVILGSFINIHNELPQYVWAHLSLITASEVLLLFVVWHYRERDIWVPFVVLTIVATIYNILDFFGVFGAMTNQAGMINAIMLFAMIILYYLLALKLLIRMDHE